MPRLPGAAKRLIQQVQAEKPKATADPEGDPDGLAVWRTIKFDKRTSKWLAPLMEQIDDPRLHDVKVTEAGYLHVTFVHTPQADWRDPFPLTEAAEVVAAESSG